MTSEIILESKLNTHTLEELEMFDPNPVSIIVNKLLHISGSTKKRDIQALNHLAVGLAVSDMNRQTSSNNKNIHYIETRNQWRASVMREGKRVLIKSHVNFKIVEEALSEYLRNEMKVA